MQKTASLLAHVLKSSISISSSGAPLSRFSYLRQDFTSGGHWFPEFPKENAVKSDAALSSIQTLPLFEPKLIMWFMIFHCWERRCFLPASSPDSDAPWTKRPYGFGSCLLLNFLAQSEVVLLLFLKGTGSYRKITPMLGRTKEPSISHIFLSLTVPNTGYF